MLEIIATYSPCCKIFREGDAEPGIMHSAIPHERKVVRLVDIADVRRALLRYARHADGEFGNWTPCRLLEDGPDTCDCGLDELLRKMKAI